MAAFDAWGGSWSSAWSLSWTGEHAVVEPPPTPDPGPSEIGVGTTILGKGRAFTRKRYNELVQELLAEAAQKTAAVVERKRIKPTERAVIEATKRAEPDELERLKKIWVNAANHIAKLAAIDTEHSRMADRLAQHFAEMEAKAIEEDDEDVLLLL